MLDGWIAPSARGSIRMRPCSICSRIVWSLRITVISGIGKARRRRRWLVVARIVRAIKSQQTAYRPGITNLSDGRDVPVICGKPSEAGASCYLLIASVSEPDPRSTDTTQTGCLGSGSLTLAVKSLMLQAPEMMSGGAGRSGQPLREHHAGVV